MLLVGSPAVGAGGAKDGSTHSVGVAQSKNSFCLPNIPEHKPSFISKWVIHVPGVDGQSFGSLLCLASCPPLGDSKRTTRPQSVPHSCCPDM